MSHTSGVSTGAVVMMPVTINDYVAGGESINLRGTIFGDTVANPTVFGISGTVPATGNSLGVVLFVTFINAIIRLYQITGGVLTEIPSTVGLNASVIIFIKSA